MKTKTLIVAVVAAVVGFGAAEAKKGKYPWATPALNADHKMTKAEYLCLVKSINREEPIDTSERWLLTQFKAEPKPKGLNVRLDFEPKAHAEFPENYSVPRTIKSLTLYVLNVRLRRRFFEIEPEDVAVAVKVRGKPFGTYHHGDWNIVWK